jgi:hypothetical protein
MTNTVQLLNPTRLHELARQASDLQEQSRQARNLAVTNQWQIAEDRRFHEITASIARRALEAAGRPAFTLRAMRLELTDYKTAERREIECPNLLGIPFPSSLSEQDLCGAGLRVWRWCKDSGLNPELSWAGITATPQAFESHYQKHTPLLGQITGTGVSQKTQFWAIQIRW